MSGLDFVHPDDLERAMSSTARERSTTPTRTSGSSPLLSAFAQHVRSPNAGNLSALVASQYSLDAVAAILGLVLSWRNQVLRLRQAAATDPLTGLANRAGFLEHWHEREAAGALVPGVLFSIDLDGFKRVNDTYGHLVGDELLVDVAVRIKETVRPTDVVARLGGDEFVVVAPLLGERDEDAIAALYGAKAAGRDGWRRAPDPA